MNKKTESLTISLTAEEKQFIKECAESHFLPISDFIVLSALACIPNERNHDYDDASDLYLMPMRDNVIDAISEDLQKTV